MRIEDVEDGVGSVHLGLLEVATDLLAARGGEDGDLLPGHDLRARLDRDRRQGRHVGQRLFPLHGRPTQHLREKGKT